MFCAGYTTICIPRYFFDIVSAIQQNDLPRDKKAASSCERCTAACYDCMPAAQPLLTTYDLNGVRRRATMLIL